MKKYKDMTPTERAELKAANESTMAKYEAGRAAAVAAHVAPVISQAELDADHAATMRRIAARSRRSFAAGLEF